MSANRAPMGVTPKATPTDPAAQVAANPRTGIRPVERPRSGRDDAGRVHGTARQHRCRAGDRRADAAATNAAQQAGATAADAVNVVLKDVAQKFEAFGKEASVYFEGRARLLSVVVAIALAFLAHVDAVDLFRTYLRDPNARAKVIEQSEAVTAQHKAAEDAATALKAIDEDATSTPDEVKKQIETIKHDWKEAIAKAIQRSSNMPILACRSAGTTNASSGRRCTSWLGPAKTRTRKRAKASTSLWKDCGKNQMAKRDMWVQVPTAPGVWFYLFLGGLLVGLGAPFWYNAVTGLTNIRNAARGTTSADAQTRAPLPSPRRPARYSRRRRSMSSGFRAPLNSEGQRG